MAEDGGRKLLVVERSLAEGFIGSGGPRGPGATMNTEKVGPYYLIFLIAPILIVGTLLLIRDYFLPDAYAYGCCTVLIFLGLIWMYSVIRIIRFKYPQQSVATGTHP